MKDRIEQGIVNFLKTFRAKHGNKGDRRIDAKRSNVFKEVSHIGIAVRSLEKALPFYRDTLGLSVSKIEEVPHEGVRVAILPIGRTRIELLEPLNEQSPLHKILDRRGEGVHHVALSTESLSDVLSGLKKKGIEPIGAPREGAGGSRITFVHPKESSGVLIELCQEPPTSP